ncbi:hypothetical protein [Streptomyces sp. NPDC056663]
MSLLTWDYDGDLFCALTTGTGAGDGRLTPHLAGGIGRRRVEITRPW